MTKQEEMISEIERLYALHDAVERKWMELSEDVFNLTEEQKIQIKVVKDLRNAYLMGGK